MPETRVVNMRHEEYDVRIDRQSKWGNPFKMQANGDLERYRVIEAYRQWITQGDGQHLLADLEELRGKRLGCWCSPKACHGDVLVELLGKRGT